MGGLYSVILKSGDALRSIETNLDLVRRCPTDATNLLDNDLAHKGFL